jgi:hypothetical protein
LFPQPFDFFCVRYGNRNSLLALFDHRHWDLGKEWLRRRGGDPGRGRFARGVVAVLISLIALLLMKAGPASEDRESN